MITYDDQIQLVKSRFFKMWSTPAGKVLIVLTVLFDLLLIIFIAAVFIFSDTILNNIIKPRLENSITHKGESDLKIGKINFHPFSNSFDITNLRLMTKNNLQENNVINIGIPEIKIKNVNWLSLLINNGLHISDIEMNQPSIKITNDETAKELQITKASSGNNSNDMQSVEQIILSAIPKKLQPLKIDHLSINNSYITRHVKQQQIPSTMDSVKKLSLIINDIELGTYNSTKRLYFADDIKINAKGIYHIIEESYYGLRIDSLSLSTKDSLLTIYSLDYKPYVTDSIFYEGKRYRTNRYKTNIKKIKAAGIDFQNIIRNSSVSINKVYVDSFLIDILTNKRLMTNPFRENPKMPNELIVSVKNKLSIDSLHLSRGILKYSELFAYSSKPAVLPFTNLNGVIGNISNYSSGKKKNTTRVNVSAHLADAGKLSVVMNMNLLSQALSFSYKGKLDTMDLTKLNEFLKLDAGVIIKSGRVNNITFNVNVDSGYTSGSIIPLYNNLKIEILNKEESSTNILTKALSLFARKTSIHESNPEDDELRIGKVYSKHVPSNPFFRFIWIPLRESLKETAGF